jgi:hypothetical protein
VNRSNRVRTYLAILLSDTYYQRSFVIEILWGDHFWHHGEKIKRFLRIGSNAQIVGIRQSSFVVVERNPWSSLRTDTKLKAAPGIPNGGVSQVKSNGQNHSEEEEH